MGAVVDLDDVEDVESTTTWVIRLDLLPEDKDVILSGGWLHNVWLTVSPETEVPRHTAAYIWNIPTTREGDGTGTEIRWQPLGSNVNGRMHTWNSPVAGFFPWYLNIVPAANCCRHAVNNRGHDQDPHDEYPDAGGRV